MKLAQNSVHYGLTWTQYWIFAFNNRQVRGLEL